MRERVDTIAPPPAAFSLERRLAGETQRETILAGGSADSQATTRP